MTTDNCVKLCSWSPWAEIWDALWRLPLFFKRSFVLRKARAGKPSVTEMKMQLAGLRKPLASTMEALYSKYHQTCLAEDPPLKDSMPSIRAVFLKKGWKLWKQQLHPVDFFGTYHDIDIAIVCKKVTFLWLGVRVVSGCLLKTREVSWRRGNCVLLFRKPSHVPYQYDTRSNNLHLVVEKELPVTENGINWKALILSLPTPENTKAGVDWQDSYLPSSYWTQSLCPNM